ncbi:Unknown protein sequence [Pseudomonas syringae pv. cilantro]|uniref:Uncharacterized protein n=1 Tax=Pseudomonas syringae pv. cilantro TaxID=81035 RepID=A0A0N0GEZ5_PSESX|nr:Unknown protein sequence [Pseudomonas syringae pv. cilantro]
MSKKCEWFGHDFESKGEDRSMDFQNERFECSRCFESYNDNAYGPA